MPAGRNRLQSETQSGSNHRRLSVPDAVSLVNGAAEEPSAFIIQMFLVPFEFAASVPSNARAESNTILLPSGSQIPGTIFRGWTAVSLVSEVAPEPSAFITQMFGLSLALRALLPSKARPELNAILVPSVDRTGPKLSALLAVSFVSGVVPEPSAFTTQTLKVWLGALMASLPSKARPEPNVIVIAFRGGGGPEVPPPQPARSHKPERKSKNIRDFFIYVTSNVHSPYAGTIHILTTALL